MRQFDVLMQRSALAALAAACLAVCSDAQSPPMLAFCSTRDGSNVIFTMDADGSNPTNLTGSHGYQDSPAWSPDGTRIAFVSTQDGPLDVYVMDVDGSNVHNLTRNPQHERSPAWSPDGALIAFSGQVEPGDLANDVFAITADGGSRVNLTADQPVSQTLNPFASNRNPRWSPDGSLVAFSTDRDGDFEIYVMTGFGYQPVNLTRNSLSHDHEPAWSPDGTRIAFRSDRDASWDIYVMNSDGSNPTNLTETASDDWNPAWSPDGTMLAFVSERDGNAEIYVMGADGSNPANLSNHPASDTEPAWSPCGSITVVVAKSWAEVKAGIAQPNRGGFPTKHLRGAPQ